MWEILVFLLLGDPDMKRKRYTEEQIISILKEHQAGASVPDLARRHGVVENPIYRWKPGLAGWKSLKPNGFASSKPRT